MGGGGDGDGFAEWRVEGKKGPGRKEGTVVLFFFSFLLLAS